MLSALTGAPFSGQSRMSVNAKSPLTGAIGDSQAGGFFPAELKFAGFDGMVISGQAASPVYLWIHDGEIEIRDGSDLWGEDVPTTQELIQEELGDPEIKALCIGIAGENLVRISAIINDHNRAAARGGPGAVMGSKNLKAIHIRYSFNQQNKVRRLCRN